MALSLLDQYIIDTGPAHYWPLNESSGAAVDAIAGLNSSSLNCTQGSASGASDGSTAYAFNTAQFVKFASNALPTSGPFTIGFGCFIFSEAFTQKFVVDNLGNCQSVTLSTTTGWGMSTAYALSSFAYSGWHYVHLVWNGTAYNYYIDGVLKASGTGPIAYTGLATTFGFGNADASGFGIQGDLQKVGFWTSQLSSTTVSGIANAYLNGVGQVVLGQGAQVAVTAGSALFQINTPLLAQGAQIAVTPGNANLQIDTPLLAAGAQIAVSAGSANMVVNTPLLAQGAQIAVTPGGAMFTIGGGVLDTGGVDIIGDSQSIAYGILGGQD